MSTRLEGVQIPVELDTSKAQKQLDQLELQLTKDKKKADELDKTLDKSGVKPKPGTTGTTGASGEPRPYVLRPGTPTAPSSKPHTMPVSGSLKGFSGLGPSTLTPLSQIAAGAGAFYAGIRAVAMNAPLALEAGRAASGLSRMDPTYKSVQDQLGNLRNSVNYLESYIKSAVTGIGKTYDMATAMARVHGKVPNIQIGYGIYKEADLQEEMLKRKFESFQKLELAEAVGNSMADFFKGGINR